MISRTKYVELDILERKHPRRQKKVNKRLMKDGFRCTKSGPRIFDVRLREVEDDSAHPRKLHTAPPASKHDPSHS